MIQHPALGITPEICAAYVNYTVVKKDSLIRTSTQLETCVILKKIKNEKNGSTAYTTRLMGKCLLAE
jgi:hypothetical protein